jgi:hypothetical protein
MAISIYMEASKYEQSALIRGGYIHPLWRCPVLLTATEAPIRTGASAGRFNHAMLEQKWTPKPNHERTKENTVVNTYMFVVGFGQANCP